MSSPSPSNGVVNWEARIPATWVTILLLVAVHLATAVGLVVGEDASAVQAIWLRGDEQRITLGAQHLERIAAGEWWRLITCGFLHSGLTHLVVNGMSLWMLGRVLEPWIGHWRSWGWLLAGSIGGACLSQLSGIAFSDGASGGAFSLMGALIVVAWRRRHQMDDSERRLFGPWLWGLTALNFVAGMILPFVNSPSHVGGFLVGFFVAMFRRKA